MKKIEIFLKKVLTKGRRCDILIGRSRKGSAKRSLKIEQQRERKYETKRTEKLKIVSLIPKKHKQASRKVKELNESSVKILSRKRHKIQIYREFDPGSG